MTEKVKQSAAPVTGNDEIDIGRLVGTVIEARWWVLGITAVFALCAVIYTLFATPIYSADALVQIEQNTGNSLVQDIGSALSNKPPASEAEIQLIQSRLVLGKTVHDLGLDFLKVDSSFVRGLQYSTDNQIFLKGLAAAAHKMGMQVLAEGLVDRAELAALEAAYALQK